MYSSAAAGLSPGMGILISGIYRVYHRQHRNPHLVLAIRGEELPYCRVCHAAVRYELVQESSYVNHDWDLAGPPLQLVR